MPKSVLLLEDEPELRELIAEVLAPHFSAVLQAGNVGEAMEAVKDSFPRLAICDLKMPGPSGLEFVAHLRSKDPDVPIIMLTAQSDRETLLKTLRMDVQDFIEKPFDMERLLEVVFKVLEIDKRKRALDPNDADYERKRKMIGHLTVVNGTRDDNE